MGLITERLYPSEVLLSEARGFRSRDQVIIGPSQNLAPGALLGTQNVGALSGAVAPKAGGNTGNGVLTLVNPAAGTLSGLYRVVMQDATHFEVFRPGADGGEELDGEGVTGTAYVGGVSFTLAAGGTAFVEHDELDITITAAAAPTDSATGLFYSVAWNPAAEDGSQFVSGVNYAQVTTAAGVTQAATAITREAEVKASLLQFASGLNSTQQAAGIAQLAKLRIIARS